jgi:hypothetical protein
MTVRELVSILQTLNQDLVVFVDGYEDDYESLIPTNIVRRDLMRSYPESYYTGEYKEWEHDSSEPVSEKIEGIVLGRFPGWGVRIT